jgi:hypothetical protein
MLDQVSLDQVILKAREGHTGAKVTTSAAKEEKKENPITKIVKKATKKTKKTKK